MAELTARRLELRAASDGSEGSEPGWQMMLLGDPLSVIRTATIEHQQLIAPSQGGEGTA